MLAVFLQGGGVSSSGQRQQLGLVRQEGLEEAFPLATREGRSLKLRGAPLAIFEEFDISAMIYLWQ